MDLGQSWKPGKKGNREQEDELLARYYGKHGGLLFAEVNVTFPLKKSRQRKVDGVRIPEPPESMEGAYHYGSENRRMIWKLIQNHTAEIIEIHDWGFQVFGQVIGKSEILLNMLEPHDLQKTVIVKDEDTILEGPGAQTEFDGQGNIKIKTEQGYVRDKATQAVFDDYDITVVVLE